MNPSSVILHWLGFLLAMSFIAFMAFMASMILYEVGCRIFVYFHGGDE